MTSWRTFPGRTRARPRDDPSPAGDPSEPSAAEVAEAERLLRVVGGVHGGLAHRAARTLAGAPPAVVALAAGPVLAEMVARAWTLGWQPAELRWHGRRRGGTAPARLLDAAIGVDAGTHAGHDVHPAWRAQLAEVGAEVPDRASTVDPRWLHDLAGDAGAGAGGGVVDLSDAVVALVGELALLPRLQVLLPPPGRPDIALDVVAPDVEVVAAGIDPRVLERVRALLAKAESTTFEAEAQVFTAKAHELMTRHSLEHALVVGRAGDDRHRPVARRLRLDDPYSSVKAHLVQVIAEASRCRAVSHRGISMSTVVGFEADVEAVEVLFTSLLVQAQTSLQQVARASSAGSRERSRGFRSSFLRGFTQRIGDRLVAAGADAVAEVDRARGGALVPVLAAREADVDAELARLFPRVVTSAGSGPSDALGFRAGAAAAERAELPWDRLGPRAG